MRTSLSFMVSLISLTAAMIAAPVKNYCVTVAAPDVDCAGRVVTCQLPADARSARAVRDAAGHQWPLQVEADGTARFVVPTQSAGETLTFSLEDGAAPKTAGVSAAAADGELQIAVAGRPAFSFKTDRDKVPRADIKPEFRRAGYVHSIYSPAGKLVTDDYPSNHVHHHGLWTPWVKTQFQGRSPDFWNMGSKTGIEDFVALDRSWSGAVHGGFVARLKMTDLSAPSPVVALNETWEVTAYDVPGAAKPVRMFELVVTQTCATSDPVLLPTYIYGGFGFRGAGEWNGPGKATLFLTSEGETDRVKGNNSRGRWCYLGGLIGGAESGTAILGHPDNFRAPQPMRLHPTMPYMSFAPQVIGDFAIEPGKPYVARFRFVVTDGAPDRAMIDAYWNGYARPAVATVAAP